MTERRVFLAAIISVGFFAVYTQFLVRQYPQLRSSSPKQATEQTSNAIAQSAVSTGAVATLDLPSESVFILSSPELQLEIGEKSGAIRSVLLARFQDEQGLEGMRFSTELPLARLTFAEGATWEQVSHSDRTAIFRVSEAGGCAHEIQYALSETLPIVDIAITSSGCNAKTVPARLVSAWTKSTPQSSVQNVVEWSALTFQPEGAAPKYYKKRAPLKKPYLVPRGTAQLTLTERYFCQSIRFPEVYSVEFSSPSLTVEAAETRIPFTESAVPQTLQFYFGARDYFHLEQAGFEKAFSIGILERIGLILLAILSWIAGITKNYGIAVIVFSALITALMAPFTLISMRSMKKMQELQPHIKRIMDKHKDDQVKANQGVFALYREHRVSPLSGCLPILLQWPILIALLQAITSFINLRGQSFLWIRDLSQPDRIARLPFSAPVLGQDLNLLPILMAGAMFIQTRLSQSGANIDKSNPTAAMLSGPMMPILFCVMLYHVPSGLVLYWLCNSILGTLLYRVAMR